MQALAASRLAARRQLQSGSSLSDIEEALQLASIADDLGSQIASAANGTLNSSSLDAATSSEALANASDAAQVTVVVGCANAAADNFNSAATVHDQSLCIVGGCNVTTDVHYNADASYNDGTC